MRRAARVWLVPALVAACAGDPTQDLGGKDSDPVVDTDVLVDTDVVVDTDVADTDVVADTDLPPDTDPTVDTDTGVVDSSVPADTDLPTPQWGSGFVEVAGALKAAYPAVSVGDQARGFIPELTAVVVGDLDEDGVDDVIASSLPSDPAAHATLRAYHFDPTGSALLSEPAWAGVLDGLRGPEMIIGLIDLDGDRHLDAVLARSDRLVQWGRGDGSFDLDDTTPNICDGRISGASLWDVDADGWSDWLLGPGVCQGRAHVLRRAGPRRWVDEPLWTQGQGDAVQVATILSFPSGQEQVHLIVGQRNLSVDEAGWLAGPLHPVSEPVLMADRRTPSPVFWTSQPQFASSGILDLAAMGAAAEDLDGDGLLDVIVTLGSSPLAVFGGSATGFIDRSMDFNGAFFADPMVVRPLPWSLALVDFDRDGRLDVMSTFGDDATSFTLAQGQSNQNRLWWSRGPWDYVESSADVGLTMRGGWMALTVMDLDHDGDADLGMGGNGQAPTLLRDQIDNGRHGLSLHLIGTSSNHEALGAVIEVDSAALPTQHRTVTMLANPYSVSEPIQFFGLDSATEADTVRVRWPSGWTQELHGLAGDQLHTIVEPAPFELDEADRAISADGVGRVRLTVRPRLPDGSVDAGATVAVSLDGPGSLSTGAPTWSGDGFLVDVTAPSSAGSARLTITVDGVAYTVRPRLTWE